jgi:hypothetical protein
MVNPNRFYTYAYLREDRTPYYIGKGKDRRAYVKYKREIKPPKDKSRIIFLKKNLTEEEAFKHEIYMIFVFGRKDLGTGILHNRTNGGEGSSGSVVSEETKARISESQKGNKNHNYGKTTSEETKRKLSEINKGKIVSEETREKLRQASKNKLHSDETKKKISESKKGKIPWNKGKKFKNCISEDTKRKMRESHTGKKQSEETSRKKSESMKKWWAEKKLSQGT